MLRRQRASAIFWIAAACYAFMPAATYAQDDQEVCEVSATGPVTSELQAIAFTFAWRANIEPAEGVRVLRIPANAELVAEIDGSRATARSGTPETIAVEVTMGVSPRVHKQDDTTRPWSIRLDVLEADADSSDLAPAAAATLEAAVADLEERLNGWVSEPLRAGDKQRLQRDGALTFEVDASVFAGTVLVPATLPMQLIVLDHPERPQSLYQHASVLRDRQRNYDLLAGAVAQLQDRASEARGKAASAERSLAIIPRSKLREDLPRALAASREAAALAVERIELTDVHLPRLQARRSEAVGRRSAIQFLVDSEAERVRRAPAAGFRPIAAVARSAATARQAIIEEYEERYTRGEFSTLAAMRARAARDPRMTRLGARQERLAKLAAEEKAALAEEDRALAAIDAEIMAARDRVADIRTKERALREQYESAFRRLGERIAALGRALGVARGEVPSAVDFMAPASLQSAADWIARQEATLQVDMDEKWQAYGLLFDQFADADRRLSVLVGDLMDSRRSAALAACQALAEFSNGDQYEELLAGLRRYVAVMRHMPVLLMAHTFEHMEMTLSSELEDEVTRKVLRENITAFMSYLQKDAGVKNKLLLGVNYYNKVMKRVDLGTSLVNIVNDWNNDDPAVIFRYLELVQKASPRAVSPAIQAVIFVSAKAGIAATEAGNRIADRMMLEALAAVRERGRADAPDRRLYSVEDIKRDQFYKTYAWWASETDVERIATFFQAQYIFRLLQAE